MKSRLERFVLRLDVLAQRGVDQRLVTSSAGRVDLLAEPLQEIVIDSDVVIYRHQPPVSAGLRQAIAGIDDR